jgi:hypothetical protein
MMPLDFIDHLADRSSNVVVIVCTARPELLDRRGGWGGGKRALSPWRCLLSTTRHRAADQHR